MLATVRGGAYGAGTPREGWDHATPWMRRILEDVWGLDLRAVEEEFALVGVNPALDQFADLASVDAGRRRRAGDPARSRPRGGAAAGGLTPTVPDDAAQPLTAPPSPCPRRNTAGRPGT